MKTIKRFLMTLTALLGLTTGAWAQAVEEVEVTPTANANEWQLTMPASDVELQIEYYTQEEVDQMAADAVIAKITAIGTVTYTAESKAKIDAARTAYNALTDAQKALVTNYDVLTTAEATYEEAAYTEGVALTKNLDGSWSLASMPGFDVELQVEYYTQEEANLIIATNKINALPAAADVTVANKTAIEEARAAYDALTDAQKTAFPAETLAKLTDAESALAVAETKTAINSLPDAANVTVENKAAIVAARTAYDALTDAQKTAVGADALAKLQAVETALAIASLPDAANVTVENKAAIVAARAAYDALTDAQKATLPTDALSKLQTVEAALAIVSLPAAADVTAENKAAIEAARAAYNALTDAQKTAVGADALAKLEAAESALVAAMINALPAAADVTTADETAIVEARTAYDALTDAQKTAFPAETLAKLTDAETALAVAKTTLAVTLTENVGTLCSTKDLDFTTVSDVKAYIGSGFNATTGVLTLTRVYDVPAGTGLVLMGEAGTTYRIPYATSSSIYANLLVGVTVATSISPTDGGYTNYILSKQNEQVGFFKVSTTGELAAGKAYLRIPTTAGAPNMFTIDLQEGTTAIDGIKENQEKQQNWYDLQGRRIQYPAKPGLYILNGKKVVIR